MADIANGPADLGSLSLYGYPPTAWICKLFVVLYSLVTVFHLAQAIQSRLWWMIPTVAICGLSETIGWSGRLWSSNNVQDMNLFLIQTTSTIIAPSFLTAAVFGILEIVIRQVGTHYSRLPSGSYLLIVGSIDLVALMFQVIGGVTASIAAQDGQDPGPGGKFMMYGAIVQMVGLTLFCLLSADFLFRFYWNQPVRSAVFDTQTDSGATISMDAPPKKHLTSAHVIPVKVRRMLLGAGITTVWVFIRSIYRTIELANGWAITTQPYFNTLDGTFIIFAMVTLNIFHPAWLLREREEIRADQVKLDKMSESLSTLEMAKENYVMEIVRPKEAYIIPLRLDAGWTLSIDEL